MDAEKGRLPLDTVTANTIWLEEQGREPMNVTLSNVKIAHELSEETYAFTANLLLDGEFIANISNRGTGGAHDVYPCNPATRHKLNEVEAWARALPAFEHEEYGTLPMDLDFWVSLRLDGL